MSSLLKLGDAFRYRELLRNLVTRDLKVRYRGSFLGVIWSLLNPLLMMLVYVFVFTQLLRGSSATPPQLLIDNWTVHRATEDVGQILLNGGQHYDIQLEYFNENGRAAIQLLWQVPGTDFRTVVPSAALTPPGAVTTTHGLLGQYFDTSNLLELKLNRIDPQIDFGSESSAPISAVAPNTFSMRWIGQISTPPGVDGVYTFSTTSDDGVRLWVNSGRPSPNAPEAVINAWTINTYFPVFILVALLPWNWCAGAVLGSARSIVDNSHLIKKVFFPRELLPISVVLSNMVNYLLALPVLFALILLMKPTITIYYMWLPVIILTQLIFLAGMALFFSALTVYFRDAFVILEVGIIAWLFLTPIFYDSKQVWPEWTDWIYRLNPMASLISNYRDILFWGAAPDIAFVLRTFLTAVAVFVVGFLFFNRSSKQFGELV